MTKPILAILAALSLTACGQSPTPTYQTGPAGIDGVNGSPGANGNDGTNGTDGANGTNGQSCTVTQNADGAVIQCPDGSHAQIFNGRNTNGKKN